MVENLWFGDADPDRTVAQASASLAAALAHINGLKPFPAVAERAMRVASQPNCRIEDLAQVIQSDPSLASKALRLANSASFAGSRRFDNVGEALLRIGLTRIKQLITAVSVLGLFDDAGEAGQQFRRHSVSVAALGRWLAKTKSWPGHDQLFLCGLLHDVGKLLILQSGELAYPTTREALIPDHAHLEERRQLGYDHAVLAGHVLKGWNLPEQIAEVVAWHHQPARAYEAGGDTGLLVGFLRVADRIDYCLELGAEPDSEQGRALLADGSFEYIDLTPADLQQIWPALTQERQVALNEY